MLYLDEFTFREVVSKEENKKNYDELKVAENACNKIMRTKIGYLDGMTRHRFFDRSDIRRYVMSQQKFYDVTVEIFLAIYVH